MKAGRRGKKRIYLLLGFAVVFAIGVLQWGNKDVWVSKLTGKKVIVIDPGHGAASLGTENKVGMGA